MVAYYQHDIASWMDGTESLPDGEYRAYHVVCQLIYLNNGPIVLHESGIAGRCNQHVLAFRRNFSALIEKKKLIVRDGKISNPRADVELGRIHARRRKPAADPGPTSAKPPGGQEGVRRGSAGGRPDKPLKNKDPTLFADSPDKTIQEKIPEAIAAAPTQADLERDLFRRGKSVLGKSAGGMIATLLKSRQYDVALARAVIETASTKHDPREYVAGAIRGMPSPGGSYALTSPRGGFAAAQILGVIADRGE